MRKLLPFFLLILSLSSFGQQIAIPYRDGNKWGVSDRDGKLIISPKFDSITFGNRYMNKPGDMISWSNGKQGLISGGKEMLPAGHTFIASTENFIKAEKTTPETILSYLFDLDGTPIYPGGIIRIGLLTDQTARDKQGSFKILLLQVTGANNLESIFVWNCRDKAVLQWLAKDAYSAVLEDVKDQPYAMVRIREKENSPVKISHVWFGEDGKLTLADEKRDIPVDKHRGSESEVWPYERGLNGDLSIDRPIGDIDMGVAAPEPSRSYGGSGTGTSNSPYNPAAPKKGVANVYKNYKKEPEGTLMIEQRDGSGKTSKSKMKFMPDSFSVKSFASSKRVGDTMYYYNTYVVYTYKGRSGVLKEGQTARGTEYNDLTDVQYSLYKSNKRAVAFIAGNWDKKANSLKYGLIDMDGKEIIPFAYDELKVGGTSTSQGYDLIAKRNGKYEVITAEGEMVISEIDEVKYRVHEGRPYLELRRDGKYGVFLRTNGEDPFKIEPAYPFPIKQLMLVYPAQNAWVSRPGNSDRNMVLVELMDANGNTSGFAREDGFLYFKD